MTTVVATSTLSSSIGSMGQREIQDATDQLDALQISRVVPQQDADFVVFQDHAENLESLNETQTDTSTTPSIITSPNEKHARNQNRFVTPKEFELIKVIGQGAFGKVLCVRDKHSKKVLAMKIISKRRLRKKEGYIENVQAERNILTRVRHPFVVTMHCSFQTKEKLFIVMDFLRGGELFLRIGKEGIFLEKTAAFYLAEIILALEHLHTLGVLHRDLKPENILLGSDGHVCLTDFGLAKDFSNQGGFDTDDEARTLTICGTQEYMAPEMLSRQGYGRAADFWSLGCVAYEMLSGLPPFSRKRNESAKDLFRKIMSERVKMPSGASAAACKLLKGLLNRNVQNRLGTCRSTMFEIGGVAGLKKQDFFSHIEFDKLERKEITPPHQFDVVNDEDLQHFHEEFTSMALPRSVVEMSQETFYPRHVNSETFRGFSFIQDDFVLPERHENELQSYWKSIEEDGESVSDTASSKFDNDEAVTPSLQEAKKRPPRKRKKKKDALSSTDTTPAPSVATTPSVSRAPSPVSNSNAVDEIAVDQVACIDVPLLTTTELSTVVSHETTCIENTSQFTEKKEMEESNSSPTKKAELFAQASQWIPANTNKSHPQATLLPTPVRSSKQTQQWTQVTPTPSAGKPTQHRSPATALKASLPAHAKWGQSSRAAPVQLGSKPFEPSSDWRQHNMGPRSPSNARVIQTPPAHQTWPSLADDPPLNPGVPISKTTQLQGVWARKANQ